jgi:hypothetical protein
MGWIGRVGSGVFGSAAGGVEWELNEAAPRQRSNKGASAP